MADPAKTIDQNLLPVQAYFDVQGNFQTFIGQGQPFYPIINPSQSGLVITNSTIDSTVIGANSPSTGFFTNATLTSGQITSAPVNGSDITNKLYVDTVAQGLNPKGAVKCATTANITLSGLQTIDTYSVLAGNRVLVKNQTNSAENGIYVASASAWTRATDMDTWAEVTGAYTVVLYGNQGDTGWVSTSADTGTIGTTAITWVQFSGSAVYTAGTGLSLVANQFSITNTGVTSGSYGSSSNTLSAVVNAQGQLTSLSASPIAIANTQVSGLGTMSTQNANNVAITGGSITGTPISGSTVGGTTITASTQFSGPGTGLTGTATSLNIGGNAATATYATTAGSAGSATTATTATNLAGGASNSLPYQSASNTTTFLASGTGVLQDSSGLSWTTTPTLSGTNFSNIPNSALTNSSITLGSTTVSLGGTASTITALTLANPTVSNYETWTAQATPPSYAQGLLFYEQTNDSLTFYDSVSGNDLHLGREIQLRCYNNTGSTIAMGQLVYINGQHSQFPTIALAQANSTTTANAVGVTNTSVANNAYVDVVVLGKFTGIDSHSFNSGDLLYLSATTAGGFTNVAPVYPNLTVPVGYCIYSNPSTGVVEMTMPLPPANAAGLTGLVPLNLGGTNANLTAVAGGIVYSGSSALAISSAGTSGQVLTSSGTGAPTWTTPTAYATVTDDTTTNATRYPLFASATSGNLTTEYTSSTKYQFNPSTGVLTATGFSGSGASLTSLTAGNLTGTIPSGVLGNSSLYIGTTAIALNRASASQTLTGTSIDGNAGTATSATTATNATNVAITDDTTTNATVYPTFVSTSSGNQAVKTSSSKLKYNPSTGALTASTIYIAP